MILKIKGNEVQIAYDGLEAVELANVFRPNAIILDIGLPRLNGYEAAREIRRQEWGSETVLIALTGWGQQEDRQRSKDAGFDSHMVKPVDYERLIKQLDELAPARSSAAGNV
jgi:DNA-binding response OmpR family regulator